MVVCTQVSPLFWRRCRLYYHATENWWRGSLLSGGVVQYNRFGTVGELPGPSLMNYTVPPWGVKALSINDNGVEAACESWHGFGVGMPIDDGIALCHALWDCEFSSATHKAEMRFRVTTADAGSSLWCGVGFDDTGVDNTCYVRWYMENAWRWTLLQAGTSGDRWGSVHTSLLPTGVIGYCGTEAGLAVMYYGSGSYRARFVGTRGGSTGTFTDLYVNSSFDPILEVTDSGLFGYYEMKFGIYGTVQNAYQYLTHTQYWDSAITSVFPYTSCPSDYPLQVYYIGTANAFWLLTPNSTGTEAYKKCVGWIPLYPNLTSLQNDLVLVGLGDSTDCCYLPTTFGGFSSQSTITLSDRMFFALSGSLGGSRWTEGTFEWALRLNPYNPTAFGTDLVFAGRPDPTSIRYDYKRRTVEIPVRGMVETLENKVFSRSGNPLLPGLLLGTIYSVYDGTYFIRASGDTTGYMVYNNAFVFYDMTLTGASARIGSMLSRKVYTREYPYPPYTETSLVFTQWQPWMTLGAQVFMSTPWPKPIRLTEHRNEPDYFFKQILDYMGVVYDTSDLEFVEWVNTVRCTPWNGMPRYYGGEKCLDILNDLSKAFNTMYTIDPQCKFHPFSVQPSYRNAGTIRLEDCYQTDFIMEFTEPYNRIKVSYGFNPVDQTYIGVADATVGSFFYGQGIEITTPWFGNQIFALVGGMRGIRADFNVRPKLDLHIVGTRWAEFMPGKKVTLENFGQVLPDWWYGSGSSYLGLTSGIVAYRTYLPSTGMMIVGVVAEPQLVYASWGDTTLTVVEKLWF